jgi:hypothetical protein
MIEFLLWMKEEKSISYEPPDQIGATFVSHAETNAKNLKALLNAYYNNILRSKQTSDKSDTNNKRKIRNDRIRASSFVSAAAAVAFAMASNVIGEEALPPLLAVQLFPGDGKSTSSEILDNVKRAVKKVQGRFDANPEGPPVLRYAECVAIITAELGLV